MKLQEIMEKRIPRIRKTKWANPEAYFRIPLLKNNLIGPWVELYDKWGQDATKVAVGSQRLLIIDIGDDYDVYTGPISEHEKDPQNYASRYEEE